MTSTTLPPDRAAAVRAALRKHAGTWIQRFYRHEILMARTIRGYQDDAAELFRREVIVPVVKRVAGGLATFDRFGPDVLVESDPQLRAIMTEVREIIRRGVGAVQARTMGNVREIVQHESDWLTESARKVLRLDPPRQSVDRITQIVSTRPYLGGKVEEWFGSLIGGDNGAADNVRFAIQEGVARGLDERAIVRMLRGRRETGYTDGLLSGQNTEQIRGLVRSASSHASATTRHESFKALGVDKWRWLATLDTKVCVICANNEQNSPYPIGEGPTFPAHPHCRCSPVPWFGEPIGTRASQDGPVPAHVSVPEWLEGQPMAEQDRVIGSKAKAAAWRSGRLSFGRMLGPDLHPLTNRELRKLDLIPDEDKEP